MSSGIDIRDTQSKRVSAHADSPGQSKTYYNVSPDPLGTGSVSPDPKDTVSVSPDLEAAGVSLKAAGSVSPDPWVRAPYRPTPRVAGSISPDGDPYRRQPLKVQTYGLGLKL